MTPTADRITEIQQALSKSGSYTGTPSGVWDDTTVEAMKKFQAGHDLNPTGKLDALTLEKLGLGSDTAGVAPPTPAPGTSTVSRLVPPGSATHPE
jgi:peptidoglycan hydrolase-like protein with peptidoglycan-binding domain